MALPIFTTGSDIIKIVEYLKTKAIGESIEEVKNVLGKTVLDPRKINAYKLWGIIRQEGNNIKLDNLGRELSRSKPENRYLQFNQILRSIKPYNSALEWIFHQNLDSVTNIDIAAFWHERYLSHLGSAKEETIKDMAICFFNLCQEAGIGKIVLGRKKGRATRIDISRDDLGQYIGETALSPTLPIESEPEIIEEIAKPIEERERKLEPVIEKEIPPKPRIFISHGKNYDIVEQIKTMLDLAELEYEIAEEEETTAIPVPEKVLSAMRRSYAAVICVTADEAEKREDGTYGINQNVLIEIGAAFVLYDKKVILLWDKRVAVPSNLQGLYRCEFSGDELSWSAGMKLMATVKKFKV